jgi:hypothetical protein
MLTRVVGDKTEDAIVVGLGGMLAKLDQPLSRIGLLGRIGVSDFGDATNSGLSGKRELLSQLMIDKLYQGVLTRRASFETSPRNHVAAGVAAFKRTAKRLHLLCRRRQLDVRNAFHAYQA